MGIDSSIIVIFLCLNLLIGYLSSKHIVNFETFSVGNRSFSSFLIFCTLSASFIGGGYTIGNAGKVFSQGLVYSFALLGFSLKEVLVSLYIAPQMDRFKDCHSVGDMIGRQYGLGAKVITGILSVIVCGGILGAQVGALNAIIQVTLPITPLYGVLIGFAVLLVYASLGGMRAVVFTDVFQFMILAIGIPLTFFIGLHKVGGLDAVRSAVPEHYLHFLVTPSQWVFFILLFVTFIFGETLVPPYVQRLFMAKSTDETRKGTLWSGLVSIPIFLLCGGIGLVAFTLNPEMKANEAFPLVVNQVLPVGAKGFVIAALLSIILSSAAGFLNAATVSFVNDLIKPFSKRSDSKYFLKMARISTVIVGVIALTFALLIENVLDILLIAYNFWSPIILVPLVACIFNIKANKRDFFIGVACGILGSIIWGYCLNSPLMISPILLGIIANLIGFNFSRKILNNSN